MQQLWAEQCRQVLIAKAELWMYTVPAKSGAVHNSLRVVPSCPDTLSRHLVQWLTSYVLNLLDVWTCLRVCTTDIWLKK